MKNVYTKPAYAHILLDARLSSQCAKDASNNLVVHYSWQVCPIDVGPVFDSTHSMIFGDSNSACTMTMQDAKGYGINICYLNAEPSNNVFGS